MSRFNMLHGDDESEKYGYQPENQSGDQRGYQPENNIHHGPIMGQPQSQEPPPIPPQDDSDK